MQSYAEPKALAVQMTRAAPALRHGVREAPDVLREPDGLRVPGARRVQRRALELKVWRAGRADPKKQGLEQLDGYLGQLRLARGVLVIFDRRRPRQAVTPRFEDAATPSGRAVRLMHA